jgi:hypothetical protein
VRPLRRCRYVPRRLPFAFFVRHRRSRFVERDAPGRRARGRTRCPARPRDPADPRIDAFVVRDRDVR